MAVDNNTSVLLPQLEYSLDKLHDTVLEASVLNNNVDNSIRSQCHSITNILSQINHRNAGTRLISLITKYMNIFEPLTQNNQDITNMLQLFNQILSHIATNEDASKPIQAKRVRFKDEITTVSSLSPSPPSVQNEQTFQPYHDEVTTPLDFNQQHVALQKQDIQLDTLARSMEWTHSLSRQMNEEISSQNDTVLTDLEANIDHNQRNLNRIMNHRILRDRDSDNKANDQLCMIILVLILILLFLLIVV